MRSMFIALASAASLFAFSASAQEGAAAGAVTGAAAGAVVGGPVGAVVGGIAGGAIGAGADQGADHRHADRVYVEPAPRTTVIEHRSSVTEKHCVDDGIDKTCTVTRR
jgi:hypothetical protein